jgi:hypothetical protein
LFDFTEQLFESDGRLAVVIQQYARLYGSLAQSVEQLAFNQLVARSNRARPTI